MALSPPPAIPHPPSNLNPQAGFKVKLLGFSKNGKNVAENWAHHLNPELRSSWWVVGEASAEAYPRPRTQSRVTRSSGSSYFKRVQNIQSVLVLKYRGLRVLVNRDDYEPETELGGCKGKTPKLDPFLVQASEFSPRPPMPKHIASSAI